MKTEQFWIWAEQELEKRHLTWHAVERQTGLSNAAISKRARQLLPPTFDTCTAIAQAFRLDVEAILRKSGLTPSIPEDKEQDKEILYHFHSLNQEYRHIAIGQVSNLHETQVKYKIEKGDQ